MWKRTNFLRIIVSHTEAGSLTLSYVCPHRSLSLLQIHSVGVCWALTEESMTGEKRTGYQRFKQGTGQKTFGCVKRTRRLLEHAAT